MPTGGNFKDVVRFVFDLTKDAVHQLALFPNIIFPKFRCKQTKSEFKLQNAQFGFCDLWQPIIKCRPMRRWNPKYRCGVVLDYKTTLSCEEKLCLKAWFFLFRANFKNENAFHKTTTKSNIYILCFKEFNDVFFLSLIYR